MMSSPANEHTDLGNPAVGDNRRTDRGRPTGMMCTLGQVIDLSGLGMRVQCEGKCVVLPGQLMPLEIKVDGGMIPVEGQIKWVKKAALYQYEVGVEFVNIEPSVALALQVISNSDFQAVRRSA